MNKIRSIWVSTFLQLLRDKVFVPFSIALFCFLGMSVLISDWAHGDFTKVMMEVASFGFHLMGGFLSIFWAVKLMGDSKAEGVMELQLSTPISRSQWVIGKFLGLSSVLLFAGALMIAGWQVCLLMDGQSIMSLRQLVIFLNIIFLWVILGGIGLFFCSFAGSNIALFSSVCLWFLGLLAPVAVSALSETTPQWIRSTVEGVAGVWNLQRFIKTSIVYDFTLPIPWDNVLYTGLYGCGILLIVLPLTGWVFNNKDIAG